MSRSPRSLLGVALLVLLCAVPARATWSVILVDSATREVAIGSVTCLTGFDLQAILPVVVVGRGAAACQAAGDFDGQRRPILFSGLQAGTDPDELLAAVSVVPGHAFRQYGIADTEGRTTTFTGADVLSVLPWAGGVTGTSGSLHYAIQGNVLTGACVVDAMEQAVLNTPGDIPGRLMAALEAARVNGGDGRCSCSPGDADACGCPPAAFSKSGHVGHMLVARLGDVDDGLCSATGCADGDYFLELNIAGQSAGSQDPVLQLQTEFDAWRSALVGRPDAVASEVTFAPGSPTTMTIVLRDWQGAPITASIASVNVEHAPDSAGLATIGAAVAQGGGVYTVTLDPPAVGTDRFVVTVDDGLRPVVLMPEPTVTYEGAAVPALSAPAAVALALALLAAGAWLVGRRRDAAGAGDALRRES